MEKKGVRASGPVGPAKQGQPQGVCGGGGVPDGQERSRESPKSLRSSTTVASPTLSLRFWGSITLWGVLLPQKCPGGDGVEGNGAAIEPFGVAVLKGSGHLLGGEVAQTGGRGPAAPMGCGSFEINIRRANCERNFRRAVHYSKHHYYCG